MPALRHFSPVVCCSSPRRGRAVLSGLLVVALLGAGGCTAHSRQPAGEPQESAEQPRPEGPKGAVDRPSPQPAGTGAFLDLERSPVGALLEGRLLAGGKLSWLERTDIDKVLREQELQAAFGPQSGPQRARLGRLLKADVLVLLRTVQRPDEPRQKYAEVVVSETSRGLRLLAEAVPLSKDAAADAAGLEGLVNRAIRRQADPITEICAVPPFVSNDLDYKFDHLKAAYAKVLEQHLLGFRGALLVEIAEAQAIAREVALTDPGARVRWRAPLYYLGEYRNEGKGHRRRVTVRLK